jgi:hypothetical protein
MSWEIERYDWSQLRADGGALGVPDALIALEYAASAEAAQAAYWKLDNTIVVQGTVYEAALPATRCLLASLLRSTDVARPQILELLVQIGSGEAIEPAREHSDLVGQCVIEICRGLPIYLNILELSVDSDEQAFCVDLLGICCRADPTLRERVLWYFNRMRSRAPSKGLLQLLDSWEEEICAPAQVT